MMTKNEKKILAVGAALLAVGGAYLYIRRGQRRRLQAPARIPAAPLRPAVLPKAVDANSLQPEVSQKTADVTPSRPVGPSASATPTSPLPTRPNGDTIHWDGHGNAWRDDPKRRQSVLVDPIAQLRPLPIPMQPAVMPRNPRWVRPIGRMLAKGSNPSVRPELSVVRTQANTIATEAQQPRMVAAVQVDRRLAMDSHPLVRPKPSAERSASPIEPRLAKASIKAAIPAALPQSLRIPSQHAALAVLPPGGIRPARPAMAALPHQGMRLDAVSGIPGLG